MSNNLTSPRVLFLDKVKETVTKERTGHYGEPENNFLTISKFWNVYLEAIRHRFPDGKIVLNEIDVSMLMSLLKVSRQTVSPEYQDNYIDLAGYAACASELAGKKK